MVRSNLSLWFGLINGMIIICLLAHNVEMQMTKIHMGILETRPEYLDVETVEQVQSGTSSHKIDNNDFQQLQLSFALSALRHLILTEKFLYNHNKEFMYIHDYQHIMFDAEAISILATVQSVPFSNPAFEEIQWTLLFYTDKVHCLLDAYFKGEVINPQNIQFMYRVHQSIVFSLRLFVKSKNRKFQNARIKLDEVNSEYSVSNIDAMAIIAENKQLLDRQMAFNEKYGVPTDRMKQITFSSITALDKLEKVKIIVVEYFGESYWTNVEIALRQMYDTAMDVNITINHRIKCLWHIKNGIIKAIKLILFKFIERYLDCTSVIENVKEIDSLDKFMTQKLSEFCYFVARPADELLIRMFNKRNSPDFYDAIKRDINSEKKSYPSCTEIENVTDYYYSLLTDESSMKISTQEEKWKDIDGFLGKVKDLFSVANLVIAKSFHLYPLNAKLFELLKEIERPGIV